MSRCFTPAPARQNRPNLSNRLRRTRADVLIAQNERKKTAHLREVGGFCVWWRCGGVELSGPKQVDARCATGVVDDWDLALLVPIDRGRSAPAGWSFAHPTRREVRSILTEWPRYRSVRRKPVGGTRRLGRVSERSRALIVASYGLPADLRGSRRPRPAIYESSPLSIPLTPESFGGLPVYLF